IAEMRADKSRASCYQSSHEIPFPDLRLDDLRLDDLHLDDLRLEELLPAPGVNASLVSGAAVADAALNGRAFFIVVPRLNQQIGRSILRTIIMPKEAQPIFKSLAAPVRHLAIAAP